MSWWAVEPSEHLFLFNGANLTRLLEGIGLAVDWLGYPAFSDRMFLVCRRAGESASFQPRPETILVKREGMMGDVLWAGPVVRALRASHPGARIHLATGVPDILAGHPALDGINALPANYIYDRRLELFYEYAPDRHILSGYTESAGLPDMEADPEIFLTRGEILEATHRLARMRPGPGPLIALHAGVSWPERTWDWYCWDRLALELTARLGADVLVLGKAPDFELTPWPGLHNQVDRLGPPGDGGPDEPGRPFRGPGLRSHASGRGPGPARGGLVRMYRAGVAAPLQNDLQTGHGRCRLLRLPGPSADSQL